MNSLFSNPMTGRAFDTLEIQSADRIARDLAERREKVMKDEIMFLNEAGRLRRKEGKAEGKAEEKRKTF
ncbi:MAG: hypothetical protein R2941_09940 [Desulfobacterales bacterium]